MTNEGRQAETRTYLLPLTLDDANGNVFCLFSQHQIVEILGQRPVQRIPLSPTYLQGVISYYDELLPVIDLNPLCGRKQSLKEIMPRQLVVVRTGASDPVTGAPLKAAIASQAGVVMVKLTRRVLAASFIEQAAPDSLKASGILRGFFRRQNNGIALIDLGKVVQGTFSDHLSPAVS